MNRSIWKKPFITYGLLKKLYRNNRINKIYNRNSVIYPEFVGKTVEVYNGRKFVKIKVTDSIVGHKFGEFANTRIPYNFRKK